MTEIRIFESTKTLEVTKTFAKAASRYGSEAYMKLRSARNDFPDFKVVVRSTAAKKKDSFKGLTYSVVTRQIKRNLNKESYRGLTYQYMEDYIAAHEDYETAKAVLDELEEMRLISQCHSKAFRYGWTITSPADGLLDFILQNGLTDILLNRNEASGFQITGTGTHSGNTNGAPPKPSSTRKYVCPCCGMSVRATKEVRIMCMDCGKQMEVVTWGR